MTTNEFLTANRNEIIEDCNFFISENNIIYVSLKEVMMMFKLSIEEKGTDKWGVANLLTISNMKTLERERFINGSEKIQIQSRKNQSINI